MLPQYTKKELEKSSSFFLARAMGADPTTSPVTGEYSTVELRPQQLIIYQILEQNATPPSLRSDLP